MRSDSRSAAIAAFTPLPLLVSMMLLEGPATLAGAIAGDAGATAAVEKPDAAEVPPTWMAPVLRLVELAPPPPAWTGTVAPPDLPAAVDAADGAAFAPLTCPLATELVAMFPPPTCAEPTESVAWLPPDPGTAVGAATAAVAVWVAASTAGSAETGPTCTVPIEPVAPLPPGSAAAVPTAASATATPTAIAMNWCFIRSPLLACVRC